MNEIVCCIKTSIATGWIRLSHTTESDSGLGPLHLHHVQIIMEKKCVVACSRKQKQNKTKRHKSANVTVMTN